MARPRNKNLNESDGSIGLHYTGIGYHLPKFHIVDFLGVAEKTIARGPYKNLHIGHNKWNYEYAFSKYNIAAVPIAIRTFEDVTRLNYKYEGDLGGFDRSCVEYILNTGKYEFLYPNQIGIKDALSHGIFVQKNLLNKFIN